ncbi:uncharacterized protein LOC130799562 [Amaranthus tricolor]|uniref:uncharacterized protein LOC130799562 n=1 Tax=Amaranthus tricolor TaxID=29722 RepID=UPI00258F6247|nr:uncharacterized protein LOC130799562 [Amaranthus tricolor]
MEEVPKMKADNEFYADLDAKLRVKLTCHLIRHETSRGIQIIQPPIQQEYCQCSFAAAVKALDYQLRLLYSLTPKPTELVNHIGVCLFDHVKWRSDLKAKFPEKTRWKPADLIKSATIDGAPLWNELNHCIQECMFADPLASKGMKWEDTIKMFLNTCPVVGVFQVRKDYKINGDGIYHGLGDHIDDILFCFDDKGKKVWGKAYHAVVLLDYIEVDDVLYVYYQNSDGDPEKSLCKKGISLIRSNLIVELIYGASLPPVHPPALMQSYDLLQYLKRDVDKVAKLMDETDKYMDKVIELRKAIETHEKNGAWEDVKTSLKECGKFMEEIGTHRHSLRGFAKKYFNVEDAGMVSYLDVIDTLKHCKKFLSFTESFEEFINKRTAFT